MNTKSLWSLLEQAMLNAPERMETGQDPRERATWRVVVAHARVVRRMSVIRALKFWTRIGKEMA